MLANAVPDNPIADNPQARRAEAFAALHRPGDPLLLPNAWDVGSAVAIFRAGAPT